MLHRRPILAVWVVTLLMAGASAAEEGSRFGVKAGVQTLTSPVTGGKTTRTRLELEFSTARLLDGHVDLALALGGSSLGTLRDASMTEEDGLFTDASSIDDLCVLDLRLAAHYYPLGQDDRGLTPYLAAGLGYFLFIDTWQDIPVGMGDRSVRHCHLYDHGQNGHRGRGVLHVPDGGPHRVSWGACRATRGSGIRLLQARQGT